MVNAPLFQVNASRFRTNGRTHRREEVPGTRDLDKQPTWTVRPVAFDANEIPPVAFIDCAVGRSDCWFGVSADAMNGRAGTIGINDKTASRTARAKKQKLMAGI